MSGVLQMKTKSKREPVTLGMDVAVGDDYRHHTHTYSAIVRVQFSNRLKVLSTVIQNCQTAKCHNQIPLIVITIATTHTHCITTDMYICALVHLCTHRFAFWLLLANSVLRCAVETT